LVYLQYSSLTPSPQKDLVIFQVSCYYFPMQKNKKSFSAKDKEAISAAIARKLQEHPEILFAYLHGSFLTNEVFNDIDLAVYLRKTPASLVEYELNMELTLNKAVKGFPIDVRLLNGAPVSFQFSVVKEGMPIVVHDDNERADFQERTIKNYFDFAPFRKRYLQEVFRIAI